MDIALANKMMCEGDKLNCKVIAVGDGLGLPNGYASTSRMKYLCASLSGQVDSIDVIIARPSEFSGRALNESSAGYFDGIKFEYSNSVPVYSKYSVVRRIQSQYGIFKTAYSVFRRAFGKSNTVVFAYVRNIQLLMVLYFVSRLVGARIVLELCEWPSALPTKSWHEKLMNRLFARYFLNFVDRVVCISKYIEDKVKISARTMPVMKIPILADTTEFDGVGEVLSEQTYVMYCGNLAYQETLSFVIQAFGQVVQKGADDVLYVAGSSWSGNFKEEFEVQIKEAGLEGRVKLLGYVSRKSLLEYYKGARALLIPLFNDEVSIARFPTKISEYLLSGVPVVSSNVGEVGRILTDGTNGFVAEANDVNSFSDAIGRAISDPDRAGVGARGKELAKLLFDYRAHGKAFAKFLSAS